MMQSRTPTPSNNRFPLYKNNDFFYIAGESYAGKREGNSLSPNTYIAKIEPHNESSFVFFFLMISGVSMQNMKESYLSTIHYSLIKRH